MSRQPLNRGTVANDGTGDTLRTATRKIEQNFDELYLKFGGDSFALMPLISFDSDHVVFEGSTVNNFNTRLGVVDPTVSRTLLLPNHTGEILTDSATQTLTNKTLTSPLLTTPQINDSDGTYQYIIAVNALSADRTLTLPVMSADGEWVISNATQTLTEKTINNALLNTPNIAGFIGDSNSNELIEFTSVAGAINHVEVINATNGNTPQIAAKGGDTDITLKLKGQNNGGVQVSSKFIQGVQNITSNGAVSLGSPLTLFNSGSALVITMPDGTDIGETKYLVNKGGGTATITPTTLNNATTITLPGNNTVTMVWTGASPGWIVTTSTDSATIA